MAADLALERQLVVTDGHPSIVQLLDLEALDGISVIEFVMFLRVDGDHFFPFRFSFFGRVLCIRRPLRDLYEPLPPLGVDHSSTPPM